MSSTHGGKRKGSGRKKRFHETTSTVTCPKSLVPTIRSIIIQLLDFKKLHQNPNFIATAKHNPSSLKRPLSLHKVPAGFPSPADDYIDAQLDLNEYFVQHPSATFYWKVSGNSMNLSGILDGSILLVDRSLTPTHNDIVLATVHGDVTVKRFIQSKSVYKLQPESTSDEFKTIQFKQTDNIDIWGVVSAVFNKLR